jgi:hypothetical protein
MTHLSYSSPILLPQDFRKLLRRLARLLEVLKEPALTGLSMALRNALNRAKRTLRGDEKLRRR